MRGADGAGDTAETAERRTGAGQRVHFEALVAVGESQGGAGFEAESVDVSPDGMRLRTAYLPDLGERLICRFEGAGTEVLAEGEVIWRDEQARGGEFGIRFVSLDGDAADRLRDMCAPAEGKAREPETSAPGARVRLHIEGLGSPMKARVRDAHGSEMSVGSNLEFLRVGRTLEIEDVDAQVKRGVLIDHVTVEIDPTTNVPQLVVSLRYPGARTSQSPTLHSAPALVAAAVDAAPVASARSKDRKSSAPSEGRPASSTRVESARAAAPKDEDEGEDVEIDEPAPAFRGASSKVATAGLAAAKKIVPALSLAGARARGAMASALAMVQKKRAEKVEAARAAAPRRTTAPAPSGALKAEGKRLVRGDDAESDAPLTAAKPRNPRKAALLGSLAGVLVVLGVVGAVRFAGMAGAGAATQATSDLSLTVPAEPAALPPPSDHGGPVMANVPLFGATPLSTTETVPTAPPGDPSLAVGAAPAPGAADGADELAGGDEGSAGDESGPGATEWGQGSVKSPIVLKIKMDDQIERINGAKGAMGFTISLPGRRSLSAARDLARKDKRLASVDVVNNAYGAEITVQFKDGVPAYMVKAKGDRLEISLGTDGKAKAKSKSKEKVAQKSTDAKKKATAKSTKKKGDAKKKP